MDQTTGWLRWRENEGHLKDEKGHAIGGRRANNKQGGGDRVFTLEDIRKIGKALHRKNVIDDEGLAVVEARVDAFATPVKQPFSSNGKAR